MKKEAILSYSFLAGFVAIALSGCSVAYEEAVFTEDEVPVYQEETQVIAEVETEEKILENDVVCDDDCMVSEDYLTTHFVQNTEDTDVVALSRPAGAKAESVKDKNKKIASTSVQKTPTEKVLYTTVAIPEVVDGEETLVSEKTKETIVTTIQKQQEKVETVESEEVKTEEVEAEEELQTAEIATSETSPMIPLKKVKTTITETTTKIEEEKPRKEWSKDMTMAERIAYGQEEQEWDAVSGSTLRQLLLDWGNKAGWTVVWKLDRDYNLEAGVIFTGTFTEVSAALIRSFARATPAPVGTFYQGNRVLVVNTQEDENER